MEIIFFIKETKQQQKCINKNIYGDGIKKTFKRIFLMNDCEN